MVMQDERTMITIRHQDDTDADADADADADMKAS